MINRVCEEGATISLPDNQAEKSNRFRDSKKKLTEMGFKILFFSKFWYKRQENCSQHLNRNKKIGPYQNLLHYQVLYNRQLFEFRREQKSAVLFQKDVLLE